MYTTTTYKYLTAAYILPHGMYRAVRKGPRPSDIRSRPYVRTQQHRTVQQIMENRTLGEQCRAVQRGLYHVHGNCVLRSAWCTPPNDLPTKPRLTGRQYRRFRAQTESSQPFRQALASCAAYLTLCQRRIESFLICLLQQRAEIAAGLDSSVGSAHMEDKKRKNKTERKRPHRLMH